MRISPQTRKLLLRMLALILVMMFGALIFMLIEGRHRADKDTPTLAEIKRTFIANYSIPEEAFDKLVKAAKKNAILEATRIPWDFLNSLYFCIVLITTIGYGHLAPETWEGQLFCIFYSLIGIPIAALLLKSVGEYINLGINNVLMFAEKRIFKRKLESREMKGFLMSLFLMVIFLVIGGLIASSFEGWTVIEGVYFTFVTLSTIGFGDFVVNDGQVVTDNTTKTILTPFMLIFMILGLGVVSSVCCSISVLIDTGGFTCCKRRHGGREAQEESEEAQAENLELRQQDMMINA